MKRFSIILLSFVTLMTMSYGQNNDFKNKKLIYNWLSSGKQQLKVPVRNNKEDINGNTFNNKELIKFAEVETKNWWPSEGDSDILFSWKKIKANKSGEINLGKAKKQNDYTVTYLATYIDADRFLEAELNIESPYLFEVYLDDQMIKANYTIAKEEVKEISKNIVLEQGKHLLLIKTMYVGESKLDWMMKSSISIKAPYSIQDFGLSTDADKSMDMELLLDGERVSAVDISADGSMYAIQFAEKFPPEGKTIRWWEIRNSQTNELIYTYRNALLMVKKEEQCGCMILIAIVWKQ